MKYTEKLSRIILLAIYAAIAYFALKYFGNIVGYIILSLILALIAKPLMSLMHKIKIRGKSIPDTALAIVTIMLILLVLCSIIASLVPVFSEVIRNISSLANGDGLDGLSRSLASLNASLRNIFGLAHDFKIEVAAMDALSSLFSFSMFSNVLGTVASTIGSIGVGLFSVVFIAFFLIKDNKLFPSVVATVTPDRHIDNVNSSISEVERLLSRYFVGLIIEMGSVGLIDFIGLWSIARLDFNTALGIGFMAGILNIIPYIGPLFGTVIGSVMAIALKFCSTGVIPDVKLGVFIAIVLAIFLFAQFIDNVLFQPLIYSTSVQAHPLEIFLILLIAGSIGGIVGMLLAIPGYTVIRVLCFQFFPDAKIVKALLHKK